jgi:hypothetical protein
MDDSIILSERMLRLAAAIFAASKNSILSIKEAEALRRRSAELHAESYRPKALAGGALARALARQRTPPPSKVATTASEPFAMLLAIAAIL